MATATLALPDDIDVLKALVSSMRVELTAAKARASAADALVTHLEQQIALLRRHKYGASTDRSQRLAFVIELLVNPMMGVSRMGDPRGQWPLMIALNLLLFVAGGWLVRTRLTAARVQV